MLTGDHSKQSKVDEIDKWMITQIKPKNVTKDEMQMEKSYEEMCLLLSKHSTVPVKKMTVYEFYTLMSLIKQKKLQ